MSQQQNLSQDEIGKVLIQGVQILEKMIVIVDDMAQVVAAMIKEVEGVNSKLIEKQSVDAKTSQG